MRTPGSSASAASVIVVGVDARQMGQIRETLGTEAVLPSTSFSYDEALSAVRKVRPDVVITGFDGDFEEAIRLAPTITGDNARVHQVAIASRADPDRIRAAMRAGYREYVVLPDDAELLRQAVHEAVFSERGEDAGEVIALWGSKGGVGTTFLAVNLAGELSPVQRVVVVDCAFEMGDVAPFLDMQTTQTIADIFRNISRLDERMLAGHVLVHSSKVHVLAQPLQLDQREEPRNDLVMRTLTACARSYQYCIVDCGSGLDEATVTAATVADHIVLVSTPDIPSIKNTWRRLQFIERLGLERERVRLVINRWDKKTAGITIDEIEANLNRKVSATISDDRIAFRAVNEGRLVRDLDKRSAVSRDLASLVGLFTDGEVADEPKGGGGFISKLFGR